MAITKDQLAQLNFGYLTGQDLLQFCPTQLLTSQYEKFPELLQTGCNQAYDEVKGELCNRYDVNKELSNANQFLKNKTGAITIQLAANTYVSRIFFNWNPVFPVIQPISIDASFNAMLVDAIDVSPKVKVGTTAGAEDIVIEQHLTDLGFVVWLNRLFTTATTLYVTITGGNIDIELSAEIGASPLPMSYLGLLDKSSAFTLDIPANTFIYQIFTKILLATPSIRIGTTLNGEEILPETLVSNGIVTLLTQYFVAATTLYFTITGGSVDLRIDQGLNFVGPTPTATQIKNSFLIKILSIFAIRNILGSLASQDKMLISHFEWADLMIIKIKNRQVSLTLPTAPLPLRSKIEVVPSGFKTLG